jgi:tetratricopeptide (TPR) repeat protein
MSMNRRPMPVAGALLLCLALSPGNAIAQQPIAPELTGLGTLEMPVTTAVPQAQRFFNQGVHLLYAFNHHEAQRAFDEAARLDSKLAMAYWGRAMTLAPNINAPLTDENARLAYEAVQAARSRASIASARERALIDALATRFAANPAAAPRADLDGAYAQAMARVASAYPTDPDIQVFYADAVMNTMAWDYWQKDGSLKPEALAVRDALQRVIARYPDHPGAHHYDIHLLEGSNTPESAEASADRLGAMMPAAGHMVHMPAHIYLRVGRYADASEANARAIAADEDYLAQCQAQGLYPVSYYPHNLHFLWAAATLEGRSAVAVAAARQVAAKVPHHKAGALSWTVDFPETPWLAYVRFGWWQEMLTEPQPPATEPYAIGIWHYGRALAFIARDQIARGEAERAAPAGVMHDEAFRTRLKDLPLLTNLRIADRIVGGELAAHAGHAADAIRLLREAVALEDGLAYNEPPVWHQPTRQVLGAVLLESGRPAEAEAVYREDLARFRENGWSLFGLWKSLEAQGRADEAALVRARFDKAWARADVTLTSSRMLSDGRR